MSQRTDQPRLNIAIAGATGAVGEALLSILAEREFPVGELHLLASERSAGESIAYGARQITVKNLADFDFKGVDIAFFSAGGSVSRTHAPRAAAAGAVVIDNTSEFRYDDDVPLVVAQVNPQAAANRPRGIIANPNCSTMQLMVALAPIHRAVGIERINIATYQSVSGAGRSGMDELGRQTAALLSFKSHEPAKFPVQIAFNLIPQIDSFEDNGYTREEMKLVWETQKILGDPTIRVNATAVRVLRPQRGRASGNARKDRRGHCPRAAGGHAGRGAGGFPRARRLSNAGDPRRRQRSGLCGAHPRGHFAPEWARSLGGRGQHPHRCRAERCSDR